MDLNDIPLQISGPLVHFIFFKRTREACFFNGTEKHVLWSVENLSPDDTSILPSPGPNFATRSLTMICCDWPENEANSPEDMLCSVSNAYGTGVLEEKEDMLAMMRMPPRLKSVLSYCSEPSSFLQLYHSRTRKAIYSACTIFIKCVLSLDNSNLVMHISGQPSLDQNHLCKGNLLNSSIGPEWRTCHELKW